MTDIIQYITMGIGLTIGYYIVVMFLQNLAMVAEILAYWIKKRVG